MRLDHNTWAEIQKGLRDQAALERGQKRLDVDLDGLRRKKGNLKEGVERIDGTTIRIQSFLDSAKEEKVEPPGPDELANSANVHSAQML